MTEIKSPADLQTLLQANKTVLLDFWAPWCGPCQAMMPVLNALAEKNPGIAIGKVNVDENQALAKMFGIRGIPTVAVFHDGVHQKSLIGLQSEAGLQATIRKE